MDIPLLPLLVGALVVGAAGTALLVWARRQARAAATFLAGAAAASAEVTDLRFRTPRYNRDGYWVPVVRFALPDGRVVEAETMTGSSPAPARPGDRVEVRYDPHDASRVNLASGRTQAGALGCMVTGVAVVMLVFGLLLVAAWFLLAVVVEVPA